MPGKDLRRLALLQDLKEKLLFGEFVPGSKMPSQRVLAIDYQLSRATVREVFTDLESQGLIETQQGAASRCCNLLAHHMDIPMEGLGDNLEFQLQVLEVRAELEAGAAYYAAERASDQQLDALAVEYKQMQKRSSEGETTLAKAKADLRFHMLIAESCHHLLLVSFSQIFYSRYFNAIYGVLNRTLVKHARYPDGIRAQHQQIHQSIQQRDAKAARHAAREHILYTKRLLEQSEQNS